MKINKGNKISSIEFLPIPEETKLVTATKGWYERFINDCYSDLDKETIINLFEGYGLTERVIGNHVGRVGTLIKKVEELKPLFDETYQTVLNKISAMVDP